MAVERNILVPNYLYSSRVKDEDVPWFENEFFNDVSTFSADLRETEERFEFAKRMGYVFMKGLKDEVEKTSPGRKKVVDQLEELGEKGYTWTTLNSYLNDKSIIYAFGVGTDISFEVAIAKQLNCVVKCFDPTPQAVAYANKIAAQEELIDFYPCGVYSSDTVLRFYRPPDEGLGSLSVDNLYRGDEFIEAPVSTLTTLMKERGDDHIDLLKMDIEGSEYAVIDSLLESGVKISQLALEFDQPNPPWRTERYIRRLLGAGFELVDVDGLNCLFVQKDIVEQVSKN